MKKFILLVALMMSFYSVLFGQTAKNDFENAGKFLTYAFEIQSRNKTNDKKNSEMAAANFIKAVELFSAAKRKNSQLETRCKYEIYVCIANVALESKKQKEEISFENYLNQAMQLWHELSSFSESEITSRKQISENGLTYDLAGENIRVYEENFALSRFLEAGFNAKKSNFFDAANYAREGLKVNCGPVYGCLFAEVLDDYYASILDDCLTQHYAILAVIFNSQINGPSEYDNKMSEYIDDFTSGYKKNCVSSDSLGLMAVALTSLNGRVLFQKDIVYPLAEKAYKSGKNDNDFIFAIREFAGITKNEGQSKIWEERIKMKESKYGYHDWKLLKSLYDKIGDTKRSAYYARKIEHYDNRKSTHVMLGTNAYNFFIKQYVGSLDIINKTMSHCFRYNYILSATEKVISTEDKRSLPDHVTYRGYEISYAPKFIHPLDHGNNFYYYFAPEFRYTYRYYSDDILIAYKNTQAGFLKYLDARSNAYAMTVDLGYILKSKAFFMDVYAGFGIGQRNLFTNLDTQKYTIIDYRYDNKQFNGLFVPGRLGLRFGLVF